MKLVRSIQLLAVALVVMALNVAAAIAVVAFYAHVIEPGQAESFYQALAETVAPYCSILFGFPLVYVFARWVASWGNAEAPLKNALSIWVIYMIIDTAILAGAGVGARVALLAGISQLTKGLAAYLGGAAVARKAAGDSGRNARTVSPAVR